MTTSTPRERTSLQQLAALPPGRQPDTLVDWLLGNDDPPPGGGLGGVGAFRPGGDPGLLVGKALSGRTE